MSVTTSDGKVHENAVLFDGSQVQTDSGTRKEIAGDDIENVNDTISKMYREVPNQKGGMYDLPNRRLTQLFCNLVINEQIPQFKNKISFFKKRLNYIEDAEIYRFKDEFIKLFIEKTGNDIGYRHMPRNNMFLECYLEFEGVTINGIHLIKTCMDKDGKHQVYHDDTIPYNFDEDGISIFVTGIDGEEKTYYNYFDLRKDEGNLYEKKKKACHFGCPFCNTAMVKLTKHELACDHPECLKNYQKEQMVIYDLRKKKVKDSLLVMNAKDIYKLEDKIRLFVTNFLDFITNKEVEMMPLMTDTEREKRNQKRAKRGQDSIPPIRIVNVHGHINKRIIWIKQKFGNDYDKARHEHWVAGHFFRFWNREKWCRLYAWIKGCKTDSERVEKLKKWVRKDENGHPLPSSMQFEWDSAYQVIKIWKEPALRNEGEGTDDRDTIHVVSL